MASEALKGTVCIPKGFTKIEITIQAITTVNDTITNVKEAEGFPEVFFIQKFIISPFNKYRYY